MFDIVRSDPATRELIRIMNDGACDYNSAICEAEMEGETKGRMEEKREAALSMLSDGMSITSVSKYTGLSSSEVQALKSH
ncbi:MAG: hypothetical protein LBJ96_02620 [Holosporaceae bacterium]|jgi:predicted transposase/invertase (TIGR01784 family)|nr:hypothetical protein [Holosporaceae bacterium]